MPTSAEVLFDASSIEAVKAQVLGLIPIFDRVAAATKGSAQRAGKDTVRAHTEAAKEVGREAEKAEKDRTRLAKTESKERERIEKDARKAELNFTKAGMAAISAAEKERTRDAETEAKKRKRIADQEARDIESAITRRSRTFGNIMGGASGRVMGMAGRVAGIATAVGGGFAIADSLRTGIDEERQAGIIFRGASNRGRFGNAKELESSASAAAIATGSAKGDVQGLMDQFVRKTGDLGAMDKLLNPMAKLASGTGTDMSDIGSTTAEVFNALSQVGQGGQSMRVMRALVGQGMAGAIDIKDLGQYGGRLAASASLFGGDLGGNIESFGAIAQLSKKLGGATGPAEATEAVARLTSDFAKNQDLFKDIGVDVFTDKTKTKFRPAEDILTESVSNTGGDISKLKEMFGEMSIRAALGAQVAYANAGGGESGTAAIREQFRSLKSSTPSEGDIDKMNSAAMQETGKRINNALTEFHNAVNHQLMPIMPNLIDKFTQLIPHIEKFLSFLVSDPWKGVGALVATAFAAEVTGDLTKRAITGAFTSLAEKFMGLFSGQKTAAMHVAAAVVHVNTGAGGAVKKVIEDVVKTGGGASASLLAGGGSAVGLGGTIAGGGLAGLGAGIALGFHFLGQKREQKGAKELAGIMAMPETTDAEKQSKISALEGAQAAGRASERYNELALRGEQDDPTKFKGGNAERVKGMDNASDAMRKQMADITAALAALGAAVGAATPAIASMTDAAKANGGTERPDVPNGRWPNSGP